jgi:hypothetical protein
VDDSARGKAKALRQSALRIQQRLVPVRNRRDSLHAQLSRIVAEPNAEGFHELLADEPSVAVGGLGGSQLRECVADSDREVALRQHRQVMRKPEAKGVGAMRTLDDQRAVDERTELLECDLVPRAGLPLARVKRWLDFTDSQQEAIGSVPERSTGRQVL